MRTSLVRLFNSRIKPEDSSAFPLIGSKKIITEGMCVCVCVGGVQIKVKTAETRMEGGQEKVLASPLCLLHLKELPHSQNAFLL